MENGNIEIPKALFSKVRLENLTGNEVKVYMAIRRLAPPGKPLQSPMSFFVRQMSGVSRMGLYRAIKGLERKRILRVQGRGSKRTYIVTDGL